MFQTKNALRKSLISHNNSLINRRYLLLLFVVLLAGSLFSNIFLSLADNKKDDDEKTPAFENRVEPEASQSAEFLSKRKPAAASKKMFFGTPAAPTTYFKNNVNTSGRFFLGTDLTISKSHAGSFIRGGTGTYNLTVSNAGNAATAGTVTVTDTLPTGLSVPNGAVALSGANAANWSCNAASNVVTCTSSAAIAAGGSSAFGFSINVSLSASATVTNSVTVAGGGEPAANNGNNSATDATSTIVQPAFSACPSDAYITRGNIGTDEILYSLNLSDGTLSALSSNFVPNYTNAIGFRQQDGYIWGWNNGASVKRLVRIGADGSAVMPFSTAPVGIPAGQDFYLADIDPATGYYAADTSSKLYFIDVTTNTVVSSVAHASTGATDIAFNPTDANLYMVSSSGIVQRLNPTTGALTNLSLTLPTVSGGGGWGAIFFDSQGTMYAYKGNTSGAGTSGLIHRIFNVNGSGTLTYDQLATAPSAANLDGARCSAAPPQGAPALVLKKTTTGAAGGPFGFTINNTIQTTASVTTAAAGTAVQADGDSTVAGTQAFTVKSSSVGQPLTINENSLPSGWSLTGATCSIKGTPVGSLSGTTYTIPGAAVTTGALIECEFTNNNTAADLTIAKTHTPTNFTRGAIGTYNLTVSNAGSASTSGAITVTDTLPTGLSVSNGAVTPSGANAANWSCSAASNVITCTSSTAIAAGGTSVFGFNVYTANNAASTVTNSVNVAGGGEPAANNGNNSATDATPTVAQNPFAGCDATMYLNTATATTAQLYTVNYNTNVYTYNPIGSSVNFFYNAMGYRAADNYIYAIGVATPAPINTPAHVLRIGSDGVPVDLGIPVTSGGATITATAYNNTNSGAFGPDGYYYVHTTSGILYKIDVSTAPATIVSSVSTGMTNAGITDLVFHPTNGLIYGIMTTGNQLVSINPTTGAVSNIGPSGANITYGSLWMGADAQLYGLRNTGGIYHINITTGAQVLNASSPSALNTDGAICLNSSPPIYPNITGYKSVKLTNDVNGNGIAEAGDGLAYTVTYVNTGSSYSTNFQITDPLPAGVSITAAGAQTVTVAQGSNSSVLNTVATANSAYNGTTNTNLLASGATLAHGNDRITVTIPVTINAGFSGTLSNQTTANGDNLTTPNVKSDNADNTTTGLPNGVTVPAGSATQTQTAALDATTLVVSALSPDLTITKTHTPTDFVRGSTATYNLTVKNSGAGASSGTITVTDSLPAGLAVNGGAAGAVTLSGIDAANWTCSSNAATPQAITCTSSTAIPNSGANTSTFGFSVNVGLNAAGSVTNNAAVSGGGETAANNGNNTASDTAAVTTALSCGNVYASGFSGGRNSLYQLNGSTMTPIFTAPQIVGGLAISSNGSAYYDDGTFANPPLYRFDGTNQVNTGMTLPNLLVGEAADSAGNVFYIDSSYHLRKAVAGGSGAAQDLGAIFFEAGDTIGPQLRYGDMAFDGNGRLYWYSSIANGAGKTYLYAVAPTNTLPGKNLGDVGPDGATGAAFDAAGKFVTTSSSGQVYSIDLGSANLDGVVIGTASPTVYDLGSCSQPNLNPDLTAAKSVANITKSQSPAANAQTGDVLEYTVTITNSGNLQTTDAMVADAIPAGTTYIANSTTLNGTAVADAGGAMPFAAAAKVNSPAQPAGVVKAGNSTAIVKFRVTVNTGTLPSTIDNTATVNYLKIIGGVTTPQNVNSNTTNTPVLLPPNVALLKSCSAPANCTTAPQIPDTDLTYQIAFTNSGGSGAASMTIVDAIPLNTDFKVGSAAASVGTTGLTFAIEYSSDYDALNPNAATWTYNPTGGAGGAAAGYDRTVKAVRWRVTAGMLSNAAPNNTGNVSFTTKIR